MPFKVIPLGITEAAPYMSSIHLHAMQQHLRP